mmetsp:Transcript_32161/g.90498  ORF Transcript_32161/g.90498 Transcript_32161/m.90498 type:complete len:229 (-) Transcript_32161:56-742(-)
MQLCSTSLQVLLIWAAAPPSAAPSGPECSAGRASSLGSSWARARRPAATWSGCGGRERTAPAAHCASAPSAAAGEASTAARYVTVAKAVPTIRVASFAKRSAPRHPTIAVSSAMGHGLSLGLPAACSASSAITRSELIANGLRLDLQRRATAVISFIDAAGGAAGGAAAAPSHASGGALCCAMAARITFRATTSDCQVALALRASARCSSAAATSPAATCGRSAGRST